jgi:hypothetical protein
MFKWIGGAVGFSVGFFGVTLVFAYLATHHVVDVFHTYIVTPTPPPGGYRSVLEVPTSDWPIVVMLGVGVLLGRVGVGLGKSADLSLKQKMKPEASGVATGPRAGEIECPKCRARKLDEPGPIACDFCGCQIR